MGEITFGAAATNKKITLEKGFGIDISRIASCKIERLTQNQKVSIIFNTNEIITKSSAGASGDKIIRLNSI